jgi:hypothetical protein
MTFFTANKKVVVKCDIRKGSIQESVPALPAEHLQEKNNTSRKSLIIFLQSNRQSRMYFTDFE